MIPLRNCNKNNLTDGFLKISLEYLREETEEEEERGWNNVAASLVGPLALLATETTEINIILLNFSQKQEKLT